MHKRVVVGLVVLASTLAVAAAGLFAWRMLSRTDYERAVAMMPASTLRVTYTDWSRIRAMTGDATIAGDATASDIDAFLGRAYDQDLTSTSAVHDATYAMADRYGFSALDASWEMYGQSREGAVAVMAMPDSVDLGEVEVNLQALGYDAPPDGAGSGGVWTGSVDLVAQIDPSLTPVMENLVVLHDERVVLMSDDSAYASSSAEAVGDEVASLDEEVEGVEELDPDHSMTVGMYFELSDQAAKDLRPRVELATGEAVGQGGTFPDRFRLASGKQSGHTVVLDLQPVGPRSERTESTLLSDLSQGPVLFATC